MVKLPAPSMALDTFDQGGYVYWLRIVDRGRGYVLLGLTLCINYCSDLHVGMVSCVLGQIKNEVTSCLVNRL